MIDEEKLWAEAYGMAAGSKQMDAAYWYSVLRMQAEEQERKEREQEEEDRRLWMTASEGRTEEEAVRYYRDLKEKREAIRRKYAAQCKWERWTAAGIAVGILAAVIGILAIVFSLANPPIFESMGREALTQAEMDFVSVQIRDVRRWNFIDFVADVDVILPAGAGRSEGSSVVAALSGAWTHHRQFQEVRVLDETGAEVYESIPGADPSREGNGMDMFLVAFAAIILYLAVWLVRMIAGEKKG